MASEIFTKSKKRPFFVCFNLLDNDDDLANKNRELNSTRKLLFVRKMRKNWKNVEIFSGVSVSSLTWATKVCYNKYKYI